MWIIAAAFDGTECGGARIASRTSLPVFNANVQHVHVRLHIHSSDSIVDRRPAISGLILVRDGTDQPAGSVLGLDVTPNLYKIL